MHIDKTNRMNALFECYATLLTEKQMNYMELYYADDYSLGEIAEEFGVSRQAVYDNIRRGIKILKEYEEKLSLLKRDKAIVAELKYLKENFSIEKLDDIIANLDY